jgi:hypothetical protein
LSARAEKVQMAFLQHQLTTPHLPFDVDDSVFSGDDAERTPIVSSAAKGPAPDASRMLRRRGSNR